MEKDIKGNIDEVSFMRPVLIVCLIFFHSFIIYDNGWTEPEGFLPCTFYKWLDRLSYSFMLPLFCFISGYVWHYQHFFKGKMESFLELAKKKAKRLIFPSILFSFLYVELISSWDATTEAGGGIYM